MSDMTSVFAEITKSTPQEDGSLLVYGKATDSSLDLDQQSCDPVWLSRAMPEWFKIGNVREQHRSDSAVGKATEYEAKDDGHYITARIVDPVAKAKTEAGIFTGFSIGIKSPRIVKDKAAANGRITDGQIVEISLVDRPCNPNATLTMCKAASAGWEGAPADLDEDRGLVKCEELALDVAEEAAAEKSADGDDAPAVETVEQAQAVAAKGAAPEVHVHVSLDGQPLDTMVAAEIDKSADVISEALAKPEFDVDQAKALVAAVAGKTGEEAAKAAGEVLAKADVPPVYSDEQSDILNAQAAIAIIGKLIVSEASELVNNPAEACDIQILLSAVSSLRCFIGREQQQSLGENDVCDDPIQMAADADAEKSETVEKAKYSAEQLRDMLKAGHAMKGPDGKPDYPIGDEEDLKNAIHAVGRGKGDHSKIRAYIKNRAKEMGKISEIPAYWTESGLAFAADADTSKAVDPADVEPEAVETATKTVEPEAVKAAVFDEDSLLKALTGSLEKADSPLRELFKSIAVESTTELVEASTKSAAEATSGLVARLEKVEGMATPGGPALRRTEADRNQARRTDLVMEAARFKALASSSDDQDLRKGYGAKAAQLEAQIKAL